MWVRETQSNLFAKFKYYGDKKFKSTYPSIFFTTKNESNSNNFPTVYFKFREGNQIGKVLKGNKINGFKCDIEVQVTSSKSQDSIVASDISYGLLDILVSKFSFTVDAFPVDITNGGDTHTYAFRVSRPICFGDKI